MDFIQRMLVSICIVLNSYSACALPVNPSNHGIALVHGTSDHRHNAYGIYWKMDYIQRLADALGHPENVFVVSCDFDQYMWHEDAGNCVADQLANFINENNISSLTVITHSDGGNVIRWILSNPTYNSHYFKLTHTVREVIAMTPSSGGTRLADEVFSDGIFKTSLAWLLGFFSDAVKQQRIGDMLIYNNELLFGTKGRPSLPVPFKVVVGTDALASPFSESSYCNGYFFNSSLKLTKLYLDTCSDGFLNCDSQQIAGEVWFYDTERTDNHTPINHNQSRHSCFGLDTILVNAIADEGALL